MKFRQHIFLTTIILSSAQFLLAMQTPPQPVSDEKLRKKLFELPAEIRNEALRYSLYAPYPRIDTIAERVMAFQDKVTPGLLCNLFRSLPYTANALDLATQLQDKNMLTVQDRVVKEWLTTAKAALQPYGLFYYDVKANNHSVVKIFLKNRAFNVNERTYDGNKTLLALACTFERTSIVEMLLAAGANVNIPDEQQRTPLREAAYAGNKEIVIKLLEAGAQIDAQTIYWTVRRGHNALARMLFEIHEKREQK